MISNLVLVVIIGCSTVNNTNDEIKIADNKISKKLESKRLIFSSKAVISNFTDTFKLPEGKHEKLELSTDNGNGNFKIKIPNNSDFKIVFKKATSFKIIDNDATDGFAIVNMPESIMEGYIKVQDQAQSNSSDKLTIEDKLYYSKQDLSVLSPSEKDKCYKLGSKPFPVPNDWHNDDGNDYIIRFNNFGIKKAEMRWFKNDKVDYPNGIKEVGIEGGTVELAGIGKIEIPSGALSQKTTVVLKEELESKEIIDINGNKSIIFASPMIKLHPFGLHLNKKAIIYLNTNISILGNNSPSILSLAYSDDNYNWQELEYENKSKTIYDRTISEGYFFSKLGFFSKFIPYITFIHNNKGFIPIPPPNNLENNNKFRIRSDNPYPVQIFTFNSNLVDPFLTKKKILTN